MTFTPLPSFPCCFLVLLFLRTSGAQTVFFLRPFKSEALSVALAPNEPTPGKVGKAPSLLIGVFQKSPSKARLVRILQLAVTMLQNTLDEEAASRCLEKALLA